MRESKEHEATLAYALMTADNRLFGPLLQITVAPRQIEPVVAPIRCVVYRAPAAELEVAPGELKTLEWCLANPGPMQWPDDVQVNLLEVDPGLCVGGGAVQVPPAPPGMTVEFCASAVMPLATGCFDVQWAVECQSCPGFRQLLAVSFLVREPTQASSVSCDESSLPTAEGTELPEAHPGMLDTTLFRESMEVLRSNEWSRQETCYCTLLKILKNIRVDPEDPKLRRISKSSKRLVSDVLEVPGGSGVLVAAGFIENAEAFVLPAAIEGVGAALTALQAAADEAAMDQRRRERDERIQQEKARKKNYLVNPPRLDEEMRATIDRIKDDQADLNIRLEDKTSKSSKARQLGWGAKVNDASGDVVLNSKGGGSLGGGHHGH